MNGKIQRNLAQTISSTATAILRQSPKISIGMVSYEGIQILYNESEKSSKCSRIAKLSQEEFPDKEFDLEKVKRLDPFNSEIDDSIYETRLSIQFDQRYSIELFKLD